jgi:hypothetical protein
VLFTGQEMKAKALPCSNVGVAANPTQGKSTGKIANTPITSMASERVRFTACMGSSHDVMCFRTGLVAGRAEVSRSSDKMQLVENKNSFNTNK